jgi:hypothetical protein
VASRTQYLYDDAFSAVAVAVAAAAAAVPSISTRSPAPTTDGLTDGRIGADDGADLSARRGAGTGWRLELDASLALQF